MWRMLRDELAWKVKTQGRTDLGEQQLRMRVGSRSLYLTRSKPMQLKVGVCWEKTANAHVEITLYMCRQITCSHSFM